LILVTTDALPGEVFRLELQRREAVDLTRDSIWPWLKAIASISSCLELSP
jgi:hypothetical protein